VIQVVPQMRVLVAIAPADFRCGIDGLAKVVRAELERDPFSGTAFVFRNRRGTAIKILVYDGQGFWLCQKRLSTGRFRHWPRSHEDAAEILEACAAQVLFAAGDFTSVRAPPAWRPVAAASGSSTRGDSLTGFSL
jgi:transposase